jgi:hypothetical protein
MGFRSGESRFRGGVGMEVTGKRIDDSVRGSDGGLDLNHADEVFLGPGGRRSFGFTLTGQMWKEFCLAANAYARFVRNLCMTAFLFFGVILVFFLSDSNTRREHDTPWAVCLCVGLMAFGVVGLCSRRLDYMSLFGELFWGVVCWFSLPSLSLRESRWVGRDFFAGRFDRWNWFTPSMLTVSDRGVVLAWRLRGQRRVNRVRVRWSDLTCVRVTEHAVVLSPSAGGLSHLDFCAVSGGVSNGSIAGCVLVDRGVLPDVDGFVAYCRGRIAEENPAPKGGLRLLWWRWRRWMWADDRYLDGPPKGDGMPWFVPFGGFVVSVAVLVWVFVCLL